MSNDDSVIPGCFIAVLATVIAIVGLFVVLPALVWHGSHVECLRMREQTGYATRMVGNMYSGECYISVPPSTGYIPLSKFRGVDDGAIRITSCPPGHVMVANRCQER